MGEENRNSNSFMKETVKQRPLYQNQTIRKILWSILGGVLFGCTALVILAVGLPRIYPKTEQKEIQPIEIPKEEEAEKSEEDTQESTVYITETISMELADYRKMYQQLVQIGIQTQKSLVNISLVSVDMDWFDDRVIQQSSTSGMIIGDNGLELLILADYKKVSKKGELRVTFYDHSVAPAVLKKYDKNTGLAVISVNLSELGENTREVIHYAELGSTKTMRSGEPLIAVGSPSGIYGSILFGNLMVVLPTANAYDGAYSILVTDMIRADSSQSSGVLVNWEGKIVGIIQNQYEVGSQKNTIQAYGISDMKNIIEHLSNNQDVVYMGITGADVTTSISESENIPVGVFVSDVKIGSPAMNAGIQPGDIITSMSGQPITNMSDVQAILLKCSNGQKIQVTCLRANVNEYQELAVTVDLDILD